MILKPDSLPINLKNQSIIRLILKFWYKNLQPLGWLEMR